MPWRNPKPNAVSTSPMGKALCTPTVATITPSRRRSAIAPVNTRVGSPAKGQLRYARVIHGRDPAAIVRPSTHGNDFETTTDVRLEQPDGTGAVYRGPRRARPDQS